MKRQQEKSRANETAGTGKSKPWCKRKWIPRFEALLLEAAPLPGLSGWEDSGWMSSISAAIRCVVLQCGSRRERARLLGWREGLGIVKQRIINTMVWRDAGGYDRVWSGGIYVMQLSSIDERIMPGGLLASW
jgi:hypothetical protein